MLRSSSRFWAPALLLFLLRPASLQAAAPPQADTSPSNSVLAERALGVLRKHCASCHGPVAKPKGGFGHVLDPARLVGLGQVVPGKLAESPLYERTDRGEMPPGKKAKVSPEELRHLAIWIQAGAPAPAGPSRPAPKTQGEILGLVRRDLETLDRKERRFVRYLSLAHVPLAELDAHRQALAKLVNSLSWHPRLSPPLALDGGPVFRIDLRWYRWNARAWERLTAKYPYRESEVSQPQRELTEMTGSENPLIRGDWFVATASRAAVYQDFLSLPTTDRALERLLQVEVRTNLDEETAARSGFNGSGVARNNRLLERHDSALGAYWRSYDFSENTGRQNLFERPLGPLPGPHSFTQAGGEIIFHLPNGLFGYLLIDGAGNRVDRAPGEIVSDPTRPDRLVENGISCLGCHASGLIPKDDQVRPHVLAHPTAFPAAVRAEVRAIYPARSRFRSLLDGDNERFLAAEQKLGVKSGVPEPISTVVLRYEGVLDLGRASDELGCPPEELARRVRGDRELTRALGPLLSRGTVQRQVFEDASPQLLRLGPGPSRAPEKTLAEGPVPFAGHRSPVRALAWGGPLAASAGEDGSIHVWDIGTGKERLRLEGHSDEVEALAFSFDFKKLASAGRDRVVRLWDLSTGRLLFKLSGHTDGVKALAFTPDGKKLCSAGRDHAIRVWDAGKGLELGALAGHSAAVNALAVSPDGKYLLSGAADRTVRLWDLAALKGYARWEGHTGAVLAVAFAGNSRALSGATDQTVRVWDSTTGRGTVLEGPADSVLAVGVGPGGEVLAATRKALYRWEAGKASRSPAGPLEVFAFSPDGRRALAAEGKEVRVVEVP